ncbi:MAG: aldo/keto reductase [Trueperaceae bacterium]|nr:aldo/keto reductase [Trueperaceae bacterium]
MRMRTLGSLSVSTVGLGCNNFGRRLDQDATKDVVDAALDAGVNLLDTADVYGDGLSETFLGEVLRGRRDRVVLATKFGMGRRDDGSGDGRPETVRTALEESLVRLRTDHVDLYQLHRPDPNVPVAETLGALGDAMRAGMVREIGCSNFSAQQLEEAERAAHGLGGPRFVSVQNEYSMLRREAEQGVLPVCEHLDVAFLPYFPLLSGILTGKYRKGRPWPEGTRVRGNERWEAKLTGETLDLVERLSAFAESQGYELIDLAFAYLLARPAVASVIAGAMTPAQVGRNVQAGAWELDQSQVAEVTAILDEGTP